MILLQIIFWISFLLLLHTYLFYPLLLRILSRLTVERNLKSQTTEETILPVSILIAAYNEEKVIVKKLESIFANNYPQDKIEVLVGSDASTDRTNELVENFCREYSNVRLINFPSRSGKIKIINHLKSIASSEILILTDANVLFDKNTIAELTKHFSNPALALVDSNMLNPAGQSSNGVNINQQGKARPTEPARMWSGGQSFGRGISEAEGIYIRGEAGIKYDEGKVFGMMMGPFGGCYAVRKSFYRDVPENFLVDDFYINLKTLEQGGRAISERNAKVYEAIVPSWEVEFRRKIRIATGSFQNLFTFIHLLLRFNTLSFCFFSHKVLRWLGPFLMIALYMTNFIILLLKMDGWKNGGMEYWETAQPSTLPPFHPSIAFLDFYFIFFLLQNFFLLLLIIDLILSLFKIYFSPTRLISHFFSTNLALLLGFFMFLTGVKSSIWQPTKR